MIATGWACNLNNIFVRFPYEKFKSIMKKWRTFSERRSIVKRVFREGLHLILNDLIDNNVTFKLPSLGVRGGEIHFEAITGDEFMRVRKNGKFKDIDFLESLFTGYQLYLYMHTRRDNFLGAKKSPIYISGEFKDKLIEHTNNGKTYC